jgi:hypothetical protein
LKRGWQLAAWLGAGLACGALAWFAVGAGPQADAGNGAGAESWALPPAASLELADADAVWKKRAPWGAPPAAAEAPGAAPVPMAIPVGTTRADGRLLGVFVAPDGSTVRLKPGDAIPGGGHLDALTQFHVSWTDARGTKHEQELLADPLPMQASSP